MWALVYSPHSISRPAMSRPCSTRLLLSFWVTARFHKCTFDAVYFLFEETCVATLTINLEVPILIKAHCKHLGLCHVRLCDVLPSVTSVGVNVNFKQRQTLFILTNFPFCCTLLSFPPSLTSIDYTLLLSCWMPRVFFSLILVTVSTRDNRSCMCRWKLKTLNRGNSI